MRIVYSPRFKKSFKKLNKNLQQTAWQKLEIFQKEHFHPSLKTHKLKNTEYYSFSITYKIRIIFLIENEDMGLVAKPVGKLS